MFLFTIFLSMILAYLVFRLVFRCLRPTNAEAEAEAELEDLPSYPYRMLQIEASPGDAAEQCIICLILFEPEDECTMLPRCGHRFHTQCIGAWLDENESCPLCRSAVFNGDDYSSTTETLINSIAATDGASPSHPLIIPEEEEEEEEDDEDETLQLGLANLFEIDETFPEPILGSSESDSDEPKAGVAGAPLEGIVSAQPEPTRSSKK